MKKRKRLLLALWLMLLGGLLGGCMEQIDEREMADLSAAAIEPGAPVPLEDGVQRRSEHVTLYFLSEDGAALVPAVREVEIGGEGRALAALLALLDGPQAGERGAAWPELGAVRGDRLLEVSAGVATVDLPARARELPQQTLYAVRMAIAETLTEFSEISYVNVLIGGREEGLDLGATMPVGTLAHEDDLNVAAHYSRLDEQRLSGGGVTRHATLYFPSQGGRRVLPEVRSIAFAQVSPIEYLYTLLEELGKGASLPLCAQGVPAPMDYIEEMPEIVRTPDGYLAIELRLNSELPEVLEDAGLTLGVYMAMLTDTLMGFVPGVEGLSVYIGGEAVERLTEAQTPDGQAIALTQALATRRDFAGYVGAPVTLYAMEGSGLVRVQRVLPLQSGARERLAALLALDAEGLFALPSGLTRADILAVYEGTDAISVNLSARFERALNALDAQRARTAIYAMVNTLTEEARSMDMRVVFFFEGEQTDALAGALEMRGAFARNPGMVVN